MPENENKNEESEKSEFAKEMEKLNNEIIRLSKREFLNNGYQEPNVKERIEKFITYKKVIMQELYEK